MRSSRMTTAVAAATLLVVPGYAQAPQKPPPSAVRLTELPPHFKEVLLTDSDAILLERPELAAPGETMIAAWAPSGRYVLSLRKEQSSLQKLLDPHTPTATIYTLWSSATKRYRDVYTAPPSPSPTAMFNTVWLHGADVVLSLVDRMMPVRPGQPATEPAVPTMERVLLRMDARTGSMRPLARVPDGTWIDVNPHQPLATIVSRDQKTLLLIDREGTLRDLSPALKHLQWQWHNWTENGTRMEFRVFDRAKRQSLFYELDLETGRLSGPQDAAPAPLNSNRPERLQVVSQPAPQAPQGTAGADLPFPQPRPLLLMPHRTQGPTWAVIAGDARMGAVSPKQDAVYYISTEGAVWVRRLVKVDRAAYEAARTREERNIVLSRAKQLGTAVMMYTQDYDETLPGAQQNIPELLRPYVRDPRLLDALVYTHPGGPLAAVEKPAEVELGFVPAPGGRAVIYVDGHVTFIPE